MKLMKNKKIAPYVWCDQILFIALEFFFFFQILIFSLGIVSLHLKLSTKIKIKMMATTVRQTTMKINFCEQNNVSVKCHLFYILLCKASKNAISFRMNVFFSWHWQNKYYTKLHFSKHFNGASDVYI